MFENKYIKIYICNSNNKTDRYKLMAPFLRALLGYKEVLINE
jgi:hypothetical protein